MYFFLLFFFFKSLMYLGGFMSKNVEKITISLITSLAVSLSFNESHSQEKTYVTPDVNIISVSPVQGSGMDINRVPANVQNITADVISESKNFSIVETLNSKAAGISISNLNSSPMQNDINFRGYVAGPLLGTAQAMAIYQKWYEG